MPSKKRKYNARFPAGRIKRIMQADEEVGKIAHAVPVIISRTLELFVESLLTKSSQITLSRNAKTLSPTHLKQCIMSESRFDFLKDLVKSVPDIESGHPSESESHQLATSHLGQEHHQQQQQGVPATYSNGSSSSSSSAAVAAAPTTATIAQLQQRVYQRSQSFQPSTSTSSQQYHNPTVHQKQFHLNNYTSAACHQQLQITKPNTNNIEYHPPAKIVRINSTPSSTITSEQQRQQQQSKQSLAPLEFPIHISYNFDGSGTTTQSPTVKIDYSKLSLPATSPSIKIDLSNFSSQQQQVSAVAATPIQIQPSTNTTSTATLDEDYDA